MPPKTDQRLAIVERRTALDRAVAAARAAAPGRRDYHTLLLDLLAAKLEASASIAQTVSGLMNCPEWTARSTPAALAALAHWLDTTAFALGDRLAAAAHEGNCYAQADD